MNCTGNNNQTRPAEIKHENTISMSENNQTGTSENYTEKHTQKT